MTRYMLCKYSLRVAPSFKDEMGYSEYCYRSFAVQRATYGVESLSKAEVAEELTFSFYYYT